MEEHILSVKNLSITVSEGNSDFTAVDGADFFVRRGEIVGIVGESGSGKSLSALSLMSLLPPTAQVRAGEALFDGRNLFSLTNDERRAVYGDEISMIFQEPMTSLNPLLKIGKQLIEPLKIHKKYNMRRDGEKIREIVKDALDSVGLTETERVLNAYPYELSGGMQQRVMIAMACICRPKLLIADEPTTALDVTIQAQILELINRLKQKRNMSVIFITHDLGVVANVADKIAVMYAGKVVEQGTAEDIFYAPAHPYTWALLSSMPDLDTKDALEAIPGTPPNMLFPPAGDAFAARNKYAMAIDFEQEPPMFRISDTHSAATWLLHPNAPKIEMPESVSARIKRMKEREEEKKNAEQ